MMTASLMRIGARIGLDDSTRAGQEAEAAGVPDLLLQGTVGADDLKVQRALKALRAKVAMPITVDVDPGSVDAVARLVESGADRVVVSVASFPNFEDFEGLADQVGRTALVAAIDARPGRTSTQGRAELRTIDDGPTGLSVDSWAARAFQRGTGGFLLRGRAAADPELVASLASSFPIPVAACVGPGGLGPLAMLAGAGCHEAYADSAALEPAQLVKWSAALNRLQIDQDGIGTSRPVREPGMTVR
ncbi:MAG: HisA/HisF-related TIM barrel protein [Phycisphaerales bacterium]|nr:HisA/HisF-related TIM barrel protein [Phycisphaerales bacterium]